MSYIITRINIVLVKFNNRYNNARNELKAMSAHDGKVQLQIRASFTKNTCNKCKNHSTE